MAQYANIAAEIQAAIKTNGDKDITGQVLQIVLLDLLTSLTKGYQFQGAATPDTTPTTGDEKIFYLASTPGTYTAFGGFALPVGSLAVLYYDSEWHAATLPLTGMVQAVGAYDCLIAGQAQTIPSAATVAASFLRRATGASASGPAVIKRLGGVSRVWNQLVQSGIRGYQNCDTSIDGDLYTFTRVTASSNMTVQFNVAMTTAGHKYLYIFNVKAAQSIILQVGLGTQTLVYQTITPTSMTEYAAIINGDGNAFAISLYIQTGNTDGVITAYCPMLIDLTQLFNGSIPEGYTVADFQRDYPLDYYAYTTGKVLPFAAQNLETTAPDGDNVQQPLGSLAVNPAAWQDTDGNLIYPGGGMQGLGAVQDFALADADGYFRKATQVWGQRAYEAGDESDPTLITDGADTYYPLATPVEKILRNPVPAVYVENSNGTEAWTPDNTSDPYTSPCDMDILYPATPATPSDIATAIAAAKAEEVTALNAMLTANELAGEFAIVDGVITYANE